MNVDLITLVVLTYISVVLSLNKPFPARGTYCDRSDLCLRSALRTKLHLASCLISLNFSKTCEFLISKGSDVTFGDGNGCTALHLAVKAGSLNTVKVLLHCLLPSTLEHKDSSQSTPLHVACMHNRRDILKFLLDRGADVTARNRRNMTCLDVAIEWEAGEVAKTLLRHERYDIKLPTVILPAIPRLFSFPPILYVSFCSSPSPSPSSTS